MDKIKKRAELLAKMKAYIAAHDDMSAENAKEYEAIEAEFDKVNSDIEREEKVAGIDAKLQENTTVAVIAKEEMKAQVLDANDNYKKGFIAYISGDAKTLEKYRADMQTGVGADGGYITPQSFQKFVIEKITAMGQIRGISNVIGTSSTLNIPVEADIPVFGWVDELGSYPEVNPTLAQKILSAYKVGGIIPVSRELLQDTNINFEEYLGKQIAKGVDSIESAAFATGDGSSKPTGYSAAATGANSTSASATAITPDELMAGMRDLPYEYRRNATWCFNDATATTILNMKDGNGDWLFAVDVMNGELNKLFGRGVVIDNNMPDIGASAKYAVIGDFGYYQIGDRGSMTIEVLKELYAKTGRVGFQVTRRVDGKIILDEAFNSLANAAV